MLVKASTTTHRSMFSTTTAIVVCLVSVVFLQAGQVQATYPRLTEVMIDPACGGNLQWIELYNRYSVNIELKNYQIKTCIKSGSGTTDCTTSTITTSLILKPSKYVVIGNSSGTDSCVTVDLVLDMKNFPTDRSGKNSVTVFAPNGDTASSLQWNAPGTTSYPNLPFVSGASIYRSSTGTWKTSTCPACADKNICSGSRSSPKSDNPDSCKCKKPTPCPTPAPKSKAPVSQAPVSQAPVSQAPVSQAPVSQAPVSQAPVSQAPVSQAPVSQAPVSQAPVSGAPVSQAPVSQAPVSQAPVSGAPVSQAPVSQAPVSPAPKTPAPRAADPTSPAPHSCPSGGNCDCTKYCPRAKCGEVSCPLNPKNGKRLCKFHYSKCPDGKHCNNKGECVTPKCPKCDQWKCFCDTTCVVSLKGATTCKYSTPYECKNPGETCNLKTAMCSATCGDEKCEPGKELCSYKNGTYKCIPQATSY